MKLWRGGGAVELRQLRYFLALAEHRHFGRAAEALHIAQPTLSQQIKALEDHLGTTLFERSRRHVILTPDGEALLPYAQRMIALAADARRELQDRSRLLRGRIRLGATPTLGGHLLPRLLRRFHETFPGLDLTITEDGSDRLGRQLDEGLLDLALMVEEPGAPHRAFDFLLEERILVAIPTAHPLAGERSVAIHQLRDESFILCREGYHLRTLTVEACRAAGFVPRVTVSGTDVDTALRFVQAGMGITFIPEFVAGTATGVATPLLADPPLQRRVGIAWNPQRYVSKAASTLHRFLREACHELVRPDIAEKGDPAAPEGEGRLS